MAIWKPKVSKGEWGSTEGAAGRGAPGNDENGDFGSMYADKALWISRREQGRQVLPRCLSPLRHGHMVQETILPGSGRIQGCNQLKRRLKAKTEKNTMSRGESLIKLSQRNTVIGSLLPMR